MPAVATVLQRLKGFPQDLSDLTLPANITTEQKERLTHELTKLLHENPTPEARHSILQVAALLPATKELEESAILWSQEPGPSLPAVTAHSARALGDLIYDPGRWVHAFATSGSQRGLDLILEWAPQHFEVFLNCCNDSFTEPQLRGGIVRLVLTVMLTEGYTPDMPITSTLMYTLASHKLWKSILYSLLLDTDNQLFFVGLACFTTMAPFALQIWTEHVPLLMVVLGRAISWRDRPFVNDSTSLLSGVTRTPPPNPSLNWSVASTPDEEAESPTSHHALKIGTSDSLTSVNAVQFFLVTCYGAWPSNIIAFVRNPGLYLENKKVEPVYDRPWGQVWEQGLLGSRLLPLITNFQLHPSIISFTSDGELHDEKRWEKYDPSEFVATARLMTDGDYDDSSFSFFHEPTVRMDPKQPETLHTQVDAPESDDITQLKQENELLRLEALYTARMVKQYVYHIGRLHRNSLRFNSDEAEIHTFVNRIKEQTKTISTLNHDLSHQRAEATQAQQKHVKWQEQLRDKVSAFREERRNWQTEATEIRGNLAEVNAKVKTLTEELARTKNERFDLEARLMEATPKIQRIEDYESRIQQLTDTQLLWDADIQKLRDAEVIAQHAQARVFELENMLKTQHTVNREQAAAITRLESRFGADSGGVSYAGAEPGLSDATAPTAKQVTAVQTEYKATVGSGSSSGHSSPAGGAPLSVKSPKSPKSPPQGFDPSFYLNVADNARKRCEKLERQNLELSVEVDRLRRLNISNAFGEGGGSSGLTSAGGNGSGERTARSGSIASQGGEGGALGLGGLGPATVAKPTVTPATTTGNALRFNIDDGFVQGFIG